MTERAMREAKRYMRHSLESQKRLGYSTRIDPDAYEAAVRQTERAVAKLLRAQRRSRVAA